MNRPIQLLMSAGEASGDLHAAALSDAIRRRAPDTRIVGMGGARMKQSGVELLVDIGQSSVVGITEVIRQIPEFLHKRAMLRQWMASERPDALVCVDFPDFNLRLASDAWRLGIPVVYHIPPKAWAWRPKRAKQIADIAAAVSCLFAFEAEFYRSQGAPVAAVGHPLVDVVREANPLPSDAARRKFGFSPTAPVLGLLPGSRRREVASLLPPMVEACDLIRQELPDLQIILPKAETVSEATLAEAAKLTSVRVVADDAYDAIRACDFVLAASGTVTLETALLGVPMAVVYRLSALTFALAKRLGRVPFCGLPNLVAGREIVPELLQNAASAGNMAKVALEYLRDGALRDAQRSALSAAMETLGEGGAVERVAEVVLRVARRERVS